MDIGERVHPLLYLHNLGRRWTPMFCLFSYQIESYWIPLILNSVDDEDVPQNKPMILVGNKSDLTEQSTMDVSCTEVP
jgi:hypothetical protein